MKFQHCYLQQYAIINNVSPGNAKSLTDCGTSICLVGPVLLQYLPFKTSQLIPKCKNVKAVAGSMFTCHSVVHLI